ncbi:MAG TPA: precorrin-6A/cobalt-precorrin-6A reductase, partial [Armatimonadota bacterium]|nr:precorrin-6A/cobalt-precorrin-6A reductase [Armatimonadota bacterium]
MILVLGGTADARAIAMALRDAGQAVTLTTVGAYAGELAAGVTVRVGALDARALADLLPTVTAVIDATHPFATAISRLAIALCPQHGVPYLRYERPQARLTAGIIAAASAEEAAADAVRLARGGLIFLTVGSKTLP